MDRADAGGGDIAVLHGELRAVLAHELEHGAQILEVEQQQAVVVGHLEDNVQHAGLDLGQAEKSGQKHRAHGTDRDAHGMADLAEDIPKAGGIALEFKAVDPKTLDARLHVGAVSAGLAHAGQVSLNVCKEDRHAHIGKGLRHDLHGDGFARTGRARDQAVTVCHIRKKKQALVRLRHPDFVFCKHGSVPLYVQNMYILYHSLPQGTISM